MAPHPIQQPKKSPYKDFKNCQMRMIGNNEEVECLGLIICEFAMPFGYTFLCKHTSAKQFINSNPPQRIL